MEDPFAIFPVEIWEMILDRVGDSETVYSTLKIFPQLDSAFQKKKHYWLLGKILPFIATWTNMVSGKELLKCRLGCQNWLKQVDNFLENQQPHLRPYHPSLQSDDQFCWNSRVQFRDHRDHLQQEEEGLEEVRRYFEGVNFELNRSGRHCEHKFLEEMGTLPEERNPFPARSLSVQILHHLSSKTEDENMVKFLLGVMRVLDKFGSHVWYYSISLYIDELKLRTRIWKHIRNWLLQSFGLLPNLKGFRASGTFEVVGLGRTRSAPINLPFLESIEVSGKGSTDLVPHLTSGVTTLSIRRLAIRYSQWKDDFRRFLPTLTELKLDRIEIRTEEGCTRFKDFISSLDAPQLVKLELDFRIKTKVGVENYCLPFCIEPDILPWIRRFPFLKYASFGSLYSEPFIREEGTLFPVWDSIYSLEFLAIRDSSALSYDFLRCLPCLQHLQIYMDSDSTAKALDLSKEKVVKIREQIETRKMHKSNIWELLPNLRSVSILGDSGSDRKRYFCDREKYNYFKEHLYYQELDDFREGVGRRKKFHKLREAENMMYYNRDFVPGSDDSSSSSDSDFG